MTDPSSAGPPPADPPPSDSTPGLPDPTATAPEPPAGPDLPADPDPTATAPEPPAALGLTRFTIEGRHAPGLFVAGWLSTLAGVGFLIVTALGIGGTAGLVVWLTGLALASIGLLLLGGAQAIERRAAGEAYAGPSPVIVFLAALAVLQLAGFAVGFPLQAVGVSVPRAIGDLLAVSIQAIVFIGIVRVMVVGAGALDWREMGVVGRGGPAVRGLVTGALFAAPVILVTSVVALAAVQVAGATPVSPLPPTGTASGLAVNLLAGAVIAPVAEEVMFRGFALTAWRRSIGARRAIIRTSLVFVLAHVLFVSAGTLREAAALTFVGAVVRLPIAFALGWLFVRTGSLWAPIGLHAAFNAILITIGELNAAG